MRIYIIRLYWLINTETRTPHAKKAHIAAFLTKTCAALLLTSAMQQLPANTSQPGQRRTLQTNTNIHRAHATCMYRLHQQRIGKTAYASHTTYVVRTCIIGFQQLFGTSKRHHAVPVWLENTEPSSCSRNVFATIAKYSSIGCCVLNMHI